MSSQQDIAAEGLFLPPEVVHHFVETDDGGRIHVVEGGAGLPLLLLHGFMLDSTIWAHQFRDLAERYRVIAIDHRGHGDSLPGSDGFGAPGARKSSTDLIEQTLREAVPMAAAGVGAPGIQRLAADLATVLEVLDLSQVQLVGHSMGGMVAQQLAQDSPEMLRRRISGMVLTSTMAGPFVEMPGWGRLVRVAAPLPARTALLLERLGASVMPSRDLRYWASRMSFGADASPAQVRFVEALLVGTSSKTVAGLLPSLALFDLSASLESIEQPTLVVVGSHDRLTPPRQARRMADALPRAETIELARCGHLTMIERPHEFSHLLDEFAAKTARR